MGEMDMKASILILLTTLCSIPDALALHAVKVHVPARATLGVDATLRCSYELRGRGLYAVRWYKEAREFYRYLPSTRQPKHVFSDVPGVAVNMSSSDERHVRLSSLAVSSSGRYRCEVTVEGPTFAAVSDEATMLVVALPKQSPVIRPQKVQRASGNGTAIEEFLSLNCTSDISHPEAELRWVMGSREAPDDLLDRYPGEEHPDGRHTTTLGLRFYNPGTQCGGHVRLTCVATIRAATSTERGSSGTAGHTTDLLLDKRNATYTVSCGEGMPKRDGYKLIYYIIAVCVSALLVAAGLFGCWKCFTRRSRDSSQRLNC